MPPSRRWTPGLTRTRPRVARLSAPAAETGHRDGPEFSQSRGSRSRAGQRTQSICAGLAQLDLASSGGHAHAQTTASGKPQPRMFRLPEHEALINRLGFNNGGVDDALKRTDARHHGAGRCQHRQERSHPDRACRRRLPAGAAGRVHHGRLRHHQHLVAEHQESARSGAPDSVATLVRTLTDEGRTSRSPARSPPANRGENCRRISMTR